MTVLWSPFALAHIRVPTVWLSAPGLMEAESLSPRTSPIMVIMSSRSNVQAFSLFLICIQPSHTGVPRAALSCLRDILENIHGISRVLDRMVHIMFYQMASSS